MLALFLSILLLMICQQFHSFSIISPPVLKIRRMTPCPLRASTIEAAPPSTSSSSNPLKDSLDVRIDDVWYDLSIWKKNHPSGEHWIDLYRLEVMTCSFLKTVASPYNFYSLNIHRITIIYLEDEMQPKSCTLSTPKKVVVCFLACRKAKTLMTWKLPQRPLVH